MVGIEELIKNKKAKIGIIGLGYVGLPLVKAFLEKGFQVNGFDIDANKVDQLKRGKSYIKHIDDGFISKYTKNQNFTPTGQFDLLREMNAIIICVPTPLKDQREPDLSCVLNTAETIREHLSNGQLVVLESTTYPGTTDDELLPILQKSGLKAGKDFYLAFSPEREDPGNKKYGLGNVPKLVGGHTPECLKIATLLYDQIVEKTVPLSSTKVAEAAKLLENIYRSVNIALVNELKMLFDRMDINIYEVIEAAKTKPFGFQAFYPGPGLGGHCIPIDPFYLTWIAKKHDFTTRFIELAGEINTQMPEYVVDKAREILKSLKGSKVLILGVAYKKDIDDLRESPSLKVIQLLKKQGADVSYSDPHVPEFRGLRHYPGVSMKSVELTAEVLQGSDLTFLLTDHTDYNYSFIEKHAKCILDTRNAFEIKGIKSRKVFRA
jgi:UDP-N-acetyl-D-glucosamine dehydrogenase